jgi:hypothetical protein
MPGTECVWAGHRKVTDCYLLTAAGARKLAGCGFRDCVLPVDDFLPAVHVASTHPRADVMALPCVRKVCMCVPWLCLYESGPGSDVSAICTASRLFIRRSPSCHRPIRCDVLAVAAHHFAYSSG